VLFTSKDESLNKAHVQYLEARLVTLAQEAKRCVLDNGNFPQLPSLTEADTAEMDTFLEETVLILPLLGLPVFEVPRVQNPSAVMLYLKAKGIVARGLDEDEEFVVLTHSQAVKDSVPKIHRYLADMRNSLLERGILKAEGDYVKMTQDYVFDSPSTAAGVLLGRSSNGHIEWQDDQGRTLKAIQEAVLNERSS
jgi:hypothetical protein